MKKIIKFLLIILLAFFLIYLMVKMFSVKRGVETLPERVSEYNNVKQLAGPNWGLKSLVCASGGYNIVDYAGKEVMIENKFAFGKFYKKYTPLNLFNIYYKGKLICRFYVDSSHQLIPGIFSFNDPNIN